MPFEVAFSPALALGTLGKIEVGMPVSPHYRAYAIAWAEDELARAGFGAGLRLAGLDQRDNIIDRPQPPERR